MKTSYVVLVTYEGFDPDKDERIEKAVGRESDGSGYGMGGRDIDFTFKNKIGAYKAAARARKLHGVRAQVVKIQEEAFDADE